MEEPLSWWKLNYHKRRGSGYWLTVTVSAEEELASWEQAQLFLMPWLPGWKAGKALDLYGVLGHSRNDRRGLAFCAPADVPSMARSSSVLGGPEPPSAPGGRRAALTPRLDGTHCPGCPLHTVLVEKLQELSG